jgi:uncharacterized protein (TIGR03067 family)
VVFGDKENAGMRAVSASMLIVVGGWVTAVAAPGPKEEKGLDGTWAVVSVEVDPALGQPPKDAVWVIAGGKLTERPKPGGGAVALTYAVKLDPAKDPKEIDLVAEVGGRKVVLRGIYRVDKGRLTICLGVAAGDAAVVESERPAEFKANKNVQLLTLERNEK